MRQNFSPNSRISYSPLIIPLCLDLQGCMVMAGGSETSGSFLVVTGILIGYGGYKLATKTVLEQWAMKFIFMGAIVLLLG